MQPWKYKNIKRKKNPTSREVSVAGADAAGAATHVAASANTSSAGAEKNPYFQMYDVDDTINKKIMSYFYDMAFYSKKGHVKSTFVDLEEVLTIYGYKFNSLTLDFQKDTRTGYLFFQDLEQIKQIIDILKNLADEILQGYGEKYINTIFYSYILIPFYEEIMKPKA